MPPLDPPSAPSGAGAGGAPNMAGMADMFRNMGMGGGGGGAGGAGGMPDLASILSNPGMMQMAQQMMANGSLDRMMQNPAVANMVRPTQRNFVGWLRTQRGHADEPYAIWRWHAVYG